MGFLNSLFGKSDNDIKAFYESGAIIIDVRTTSEFGTNHMKGSRNMPLQTLEASLTKIRSFNKPVILCCASGMRSGQATSFLKKNNIDCINGGSWSKLDRTLNS